MITEDLAAYNAAIRKPAAPFAVNQIVHMSNKRLEHDLMLCVKYKVPIVISSLGAVPEVNAACIPMAASCCMTSSTTATPIRPSARAPTD
jgi:NAD(P)H-dependent flavin oxidoreductase YrpB (nitropropane dioxygenase family)